MKDVKQQTGYPTIDRPWDKYYEKEFKEEDIPNMSIYQLALESNKENMQKTALDMRVSKNDFAKGIKLSYQGLFDRIDESSKASKIIGLKQDEIVPFILPNVPEARVL